MRTFRPIFRAVFAVAGGALLALSALATSTVGEASAAEGAVSPFVAHAQRGEISPPDLDEIEHMCALLVSCDKLPIPRQLIADDFASCVKKMSHEMTSPAAVLFSLTMRECGLGANSCNDLRNCALRGAKADSCGGRGGSNMVGYCDIDGRALTCYKDAIVAVRDCSRGGEQCIVREGMSTCSLGACPAEVKEGQPPKCSPSGTHTLKCEKGKLSSLDCSAFGLRCSVHGDTGVCATAGPACADQEKRCDGAVSVGCYNGHEVRVDCAAAGLTCSATPGPGVAVGACIAPPGERPCKESDAPKCDGANVKYCAAGKPRSFLCKTVGFNRCETTPKGARCAQ